MVLLQFHRVIVCCLVGDSLCSLHTVQMVDNVLAAFRNAAPIKSVAMVWLLWCLLWHIIPIYDNLRLNIVLIELFNSTARCVNTSSSQVVCTFQFDICIAFVFANFLGCGAAQVNCGNRTIGLPFARRSIAWLIYKISHCHSETFKLSHRRHSRWLLCWCLLPLAISRPHIEFYLQITESMSHLFLSFRRIVCSFASSIICSRVPGLTPAQRQLCSEAPDAFIALGDGHMLGAEECQHQFKGKCRPCFCVVPQKCVDNLLDKWTTAWNIWPIV